MTKATELNKLTKTELITLVRSLRRRVDRDRLRIAELENVARVPEQLTTRCACGLRSVCQGPGCPEYVEPATGCDALRGTSLHEQWADRIERWPASAERLASIGPNPFTEVKS